MAYHNNDFLELFSAYKFGLTADGDGKYSWVAGLSQCPKCQADVSDYIWYCEDCDYGEKGHTRKKPPKIAGYEYIVNSDFKAGKYIRMPDKSLFDTVIIESYKKQMIDEAISMVGNSDLIFKEWGFEKTLEKGKGVSMLFWGVPGTGKTLMAQAIADYLGKSLTTITASDVLSKWVGESEKTITQIFQKAKHDVLLFDECDSLLFSRQSASHSWEVSQVNVLLHELENHEGVTIFTTNHTGKLDKALDRRIALRVMFEMPDQLLRKQIWQRMFPKEAPISNDIDWDLLSQFEITGGYIKNAVLRAARLAAYRKDKKISFAVLKEALKQELQAINDYDQTEPVIADKDKTLKMAQE